MENIPQTAKHIACDFFLDAKLVYATSNQTVFDCDDEVLIIRSDGCEAPVGSVGRLVVFHTQYGEQWQFRPYRFPTWRRVPDLDTPSSWAWRCLETGELITTAIGTVPGRGPGTPLSPDDADHLPF